MTPRRVVSTIVLPTAMLLAIVLPALVMQDRLPGRIATHWNGSGAPDGSANGVLFVAVFTAVWLAAWASLLPGARRRERQFHAPWVLGLGGFLVGIVGLTINANVDAAQWSAAEHLSLVAVVAPVVLALLLAALGFVLERDVPAGATEHLTPTPSTTGLRPGERFFWSGGAQASWWFPAGVSALGVATAALAFVSGAPTVLMLIIGIALPVLALFTSRTRLTVTPAGVQAQMGARYPRRIVPASSIVGADAIDVVPLQWGGWGWRMTPKATALIVRRGEGVRLQLTTGRDLVITVDDATTAASLINDLRDR